MTQLSLRCKSSSPIEPCGLCGRETDLAPGYQLAVVETGAPVCLDCGRRHAPALAALVHLASAAERVGKIGQHTVFPPLAVLLDLASAAEKYTRAATCCCGKGAASE
jgi:hypothetical protein